MNTYSYIYRPYMVFIVRHEQCTRKSSLAHILLVCYIQRCRCYPGTTHHMNQLRKAEKWLMQYKVVF